MADPGLRRGWIGLWWALSWTAQAATPVHVCSDGPRGVLIEPARSPFGEIPASQSPTLQVVVNDDVDLPLPFAQVTVSHPGRGVQAAASTDRSGVARVSGLPPGLVEVTVAFPGFAVQEVSGVLVTGGVVRHVRVALAPTASPEVVVRTGRASRFERVLDRQLTAGGWVGAAEVSVASRRGRAFLLACSDHEEPIRALLRGREASVWGLTPGAACTVRVIGGVHRTPFAFTAGESPSSCDDG